MTVRLAAHSCLLSPLNKRWGDSPTLPTEGRLTSVSGTIAGPVSHVFGDRSVKRVMLDISDYAYLGPDPAPATPASRGNDSIYTALFRLL